LTCWLQVFEAVAFILEPAGVFVAFFDIVIVGVVLIILFDT
jgi:hypothetical protein